MEHWGDILRPEVMLLLALFVTVVIIFVPFIHILFSRRSPGGAKFGWLLAALFFPILSYSVFLICTQRVADSLKTSSQPDLAPLRDGWEDANLGLTLGNPRGGSEGSGIEDLEEEIERKNV